MMKTGLSVPLRVCYWFQTLFAGLLLLPAAAAAGTFTVYAPATDYDGTFSVSWTVNPGPNNGGYTLLKQRVNGGSWTTLLQKPLGSQSHTVTVSASGSYDYRVDYGYVPQCNGYCGMTYGSTPTDTTVVSLDPPASAPVLSLPGTDNDGNYSLSWDPVSGASSYKWQERTNGGNWSSETTTGATSVPRSKSSATYGYRVRACNANGCSGYSAQKSIDVAITPGVPGSIGVPSSPSAGDFTVNWGAAGGTLSFYDLDHRPDGGTWAATYNGAALSHEVSGFSADRYVFRVRACNTVGSYTACSGWTHSEELLVYERTGAATEVVYRYDALGRLQFVEDSINGNRDFDYDSAGNRTAVAEGVLSEDEDPFEDNAPYQLPAPTGLHLQGPFSENGGYTASWHAVSEADYYVIGMEEGSRVETTDLSLGTAILRPMWVHAENYTGHSDRSYF